MVDQRELQDMRVKVSGMMESFHQMQTGAAQLQTDLQQVTGVAESEDHFVVATVGPTGHLLGLDIDPRIYRRPDSQALAADILDTVQRATEDATSQVEALYARVMPGQDVRSQLNLDFSSIFQQAQTHLDEQRRDR